MYRLENGSPNIAWATTLVPSKKLAGLTPFVRSIICSQRAKSPGAISSLKLPTALNASIARTPRDLSAAMFAREGTADGLIEWPGPWRARNAMSVPEGREQIWRGEDGKPQGWLKVEQ